MVGCLAQSFAFGQLQAGIHLADRVESSLDSVHLRAERDNLGELLGSLCSRVNTSQTQCSASHPPECSTTGEFDFFPYECP